MWKNSFIKSFGKRFTYIKTINDRLQSNAKSELFDKIRLSKIIVSSCNSKKTAHYFYKIQNFNFSDGKKSADILDQKLEDDKPVDNSALENNTLYKKTENFKSKYFKLIIRLIISANYFK